jgi:hypothetical protein
MQTLYVYYKVAAAERARCLALVDKLQAGLKAQWPALRIQAMQRPEASPDGMETWMEVYEHPGGVSQEMIASVARHAADTGLPAKRAAELFVPLRR